MNIFIEPGDVWLFRDGRPFAAGEEHAARSIFPPTPRTMQGAIRSARISQSGASFTDQGKWPADVGTPNDYRNLRMRGPVLARRDHDGETPFFVQPQDVVKMNGGWKVLSPEQSGFQANWPEPLLALKTDGAPEKFEPGWLSESDLTGYLRGEAFGVVKTSALFERERRFGVEIEGPVKRAREGNLFAIEFIRLNPGVGLLLDVKGVAFDGSGMLQLGGEARAGRYETSEASLDLDTERRTPQNRDDKTRFKLYLATPAIFSQGWLPGEMDKITLSGIWRGIDLRLMAAAVGKPNHIGGRDISQRDRQRDMAMAVPAGSVYFFETEAGPAEVMNAFDGKCVSDADPTIGFGLSYIGGW
jgi:CRISPR-associated protein Cmr3